MIYGITYSSGNMDISAKKCVESMERNGVDKATRKGGPRYYRDEDETFWRLNEATLTADRGAGYWLWKPYIIFWAMEYANDGDILIYSDAGVEFVNHVSHIINRMDEDIFFFSNGWPHYDWCKKVVFDTILPWGPDAKWQQMANTRYEMPQVQASVIFIRVNDNTRYFVKEWLLWCQMPGFIDDSPSPGGERPGFQEGRHDQAILTCLSYKYGYRQHWWPTQYSNHIPRSSEDNYPVMFNHHRLRDNEYQTI